MDQKDRIPNVFSQRIHKYKARPNGALGAQTIPMENSKTNLVNGEPEEKSFFVEYVRPCLAEFVQVTIFVFIGTMSVQNTNFNIVGIALAHGLTIALLIAGFGGISGGHINPAVTLGVTLSGGCKPVLAVFYVISQLIGGILGAAICRGVLGDHTYELINGGGHLLGSGISDAEGILCEVVVTLVLVQTVLLTAVDTDGKNPAAPFAIGLAVLVDIMAAGNISGASMNPARSFGPCVVLSSLKSIWSDQWIYWVGPALGAMLAALNYRLLFGRDDKRVLTSSRRSA